MSVYRTIGPLVERCLKMGVINNKTKKKIYNNNICMSLNPYSAL